MDELIDAAHIESLGPDTERAIATYRSFTDLQKGSRVSTPEDWKVIEPAARPVSAPSMWDWVVQQYTDKGLLDFAPQLGGYDGMGYPLPSPAYAIGQGAPDLKRFVPDERGYTWVTNSDSITVEAGLFEEGTAGAVVSCIKERLLVGTTDNRVAYYDMTMSYTMEAMPDGSWGLRRFDYTQDTAGVVATQEELDALPAI
ncbi:hypothetical protein [Arthrobacter agilis]|uniref:hypothetical protein n=1 Tax=Arthrobacter agilis TaxID=37921 RepID=UPI00278A0934|nr:hypothetical protein [Arthrobacter agilis]MDQ0734659.1 hypothetical protein [Arthrobacter agilis]